MTRDLSPDRIAAMVRPTQVHRDAYADPDVFDLEMQLIFGQAWLLLGHDSQVPEKGDFFTTQMGRQPVIAVRQGDGGVKVLFNRCAHRGPVLCSVDKGSASEFVCPYHGWVYDVDGTVTAIPVPSGYPGEHDPRKNGLKMVEVPRTEVYRGFIFASLSGQGSSLKEFLGPLISSIDDLVDRAPEGEVEIAGGISRHAYNGNWKFMLENHLDGLHPRYVHASSVAAAREQDDSRATDGAGEVAVRQMRQNGAPSELWENIGLWVGPNGHGYMADYHDDEKLVKVSDDPVHVEYRQRMEKSFGAERTKEILSITRWNSIIFPNVSFMSQFGQLRILRPIAVDRSVVDTYVFRLKGAPEEVFLRSIAFANIVNGTGSPVLTDDLEVYERMQTGLLTDGNQWVNYARGFSRDVADGPDLQRGGTGTSEIAIRNMFEAWRDYMVAGEAELTVAAE
jgi:phenylpropionate dioxygenase-like ring-hydroxylating dioxygenase large terminal subunit